MELIGALANLFIIWLLAAFMIEQATTRLIGKVFVKKPLLMLLFAVGALIINIIMYFVLHGGDDGHNHGLMSEPCSHGLNDDDSGIDHYENLIEEDKQQNKHDDHQGHNHQGHDHAQHNHQGHNHQGHNHQGHDHEGHNHEGHNHEGHNHEGHNHEGHDHEGHNHEGHNHEGHNHEGHEHSHGSDSIGMKAALYHALSDIIQSIGILIAASVIFFWGSDHGSDVTEWNDWHYVDPFATYIFSILTIISTIPIVKNCYDLLMEAVPQVVNIGELRSQFQKIEGVIDVHDLHIWDLRPGKTIMIAHIMSAKGTQRMVLTKLTDLCRQRKIYHSTFQVQEQDKEGHRDYIACHHDIH